MGKRACEGNGAGAAMSARRHQANRRSAEEKLDRMIERSFSDWSVQDRECRTVDGKTLRTAIQAIVKSKDGGGRLSQKQVEKLRQQFAPQTAPTSQLAVEDPQQPIDKEWQQALLLASSANCSLRTRAPLSSLLKAKLYTCNQRELVALFRHTLRLNPNNPELRIHICEVIDYVVAKKLHQQFPQELLVMKGHFDATLKNVWGLMKRQGLTVEHFWSQFKAHLQVLGDTKCIESILNCNEAWHKVKEHLRVACSSSQTALHMFAGAAKEVAIAEWTEFIKMIMEDFMRGADYTEESIQSFKDLGGEQGEGS